MRSQSVNEITQVDEAWYENKISAYRSLSYFMEFEKALYQMKNNAVVQE